MCVIFDDDDDTNDVFDEINVIKATIGQVNEVSLGRAAKVSPELILPVVSLSCSRTSPTSSTFVNNSSSPEDLKKES